jgi:Hydrolase of X-linked nucleoside diphosphate N terminal
MEPQWLEWARRLQALAQTGLTYTNDHFDVERYESIRALAAEMIAAHAQTEVHAVQELLASEEGHATPKIDVRGVVFQELLGGMPAPSIETEAVGFFRKDELPDLSVPRVTSAQIARLFDHHRHPDWPTDFD